MKVIKQEKGEDINIQIFSDESVIIHQSNNQIINDMVKINPSSVVKVLKEFSEHESVTSDFLHDLGHWKIISVCKGKHSFVRDFGSYICDGCNESEENIDRLNKQFGESNG